MIQTESYMTNVPPQFETNLISFTTKATWPLLLTLAKEAFAFFQFFMAEEL